MLFTCPQCAKPIHRQAVLCRYCDHALVQTQYCGKHWRRRSPQKDVALQQGDWPTSARTVVDPPGPSVRPPKAAKASRRTRVTAPRRPAPRPPEARTTKHGASAGLTVDQLEAVTEQQHRI